MVPIGASRRLSANLIICVIQRYIFPYKLYKPSSSCLRNVNLFLRILSLILCFIVLQCHSEPRVCVNSHATAGVGVGDVRSPGFTRLCVGGADLRGLPSKTGGAACRESGPVAGSAFKTSAALLRPQYWTATADSMSN